MSLADSLFTRGKSKGAFLQSQWQILYLLEEARGYAMSLTDSLPSRWSSKGGVFSKSMTLNEFCNFLRKPEVMLCPWPTHCSLEGMKGAFLQSQSKSLIPARLLRHRLSSRYLLFIRV